MSEPKKKSEILQEQINKLKADLATLKKPESSTTSTKEHQHSSNVVFDCPECQKEYDRTVVEKAKPEIIKAEREKLKSGELVLCSDCGEIVEKQAEECPSCHGTNARPIE